MTRKVIERDEAKLCLLAADSDQPDYVNRIKALCTEHNVGLISIPSRKTLGEWAGLCKFDAEGNATKVHPCTSLVVKDFGEDSEGLFTSCRSSWGSNRSLGGVSPFDVCPLAHVSKKAVI